MQIWFPFICALIGYLCGQYHLFESGIDIVTQFEQIKQIHKVNKTNQQITHKTKQTTNFEHKHKYEIHK
jgi:hypothetical protein